MEKRILKLRKRLLNRSVNPEAFRDDFFPFEIAWFVTLVCNLSCPYCFIPRNLPRDLPELNLVKVLKKLKEKKIFRIDVLGGEPFLRKKTIIDLAKNCEHFGVVYRSTSTNGLIYDEEIAEALRNLKYRHILQISLDATNPKTHFVVRKNKNFDLILKNTSRYIRKGLHVMLSMTLTKHNVDEIEKFTRLAENLGVEMISYGGFMPLGRGKEVENWHLDFTAMRNAYERIKALKTSLQVVLPNDIYGQTCAAGVGRAAMLPNGDLYPCSMLLGFPEARIGNLFDKKLNKYNNPWFIKMSAYKVPKKCDECSLPPICDCACKAITYDRFGDFSEHEPFCQLGGSKPVKK